MANGGFFEQKSASPTRFALVVAAHAGLLGAVMLAAGPEFIINPPIRTQIFRVPIPQTPPEDPHPTQREDRQTPIDRPIVIPDHRIDLPPLPPLGPQTGTETAGPPTGGTVIADPPPDPSPPQPVRRGAEVDPRFAAALQPQYPLAEQRAGRSGSVVIRVTIGPDGRVRAAERVSATSDAFWAVAERQALTRWRFRPATVDGRPVESSKVMTIHFRIEDV